MHSAPTVSYPVGRSRLEGWVVVLTALSGVLVVLLWALAADTAGWRQWLLLMTLLATCSVAASGWRRSPQGTLRWDGKDWAWHSGQSPVSGILSVHLDLQFFLLVSLRTGSGPRLWLWPEQRFDAMRWKDLRRAVFAYSGTASSHIDDSRSKVKT